MDFVQYRTSMDDEGRRLDKVLRILFPETPLSHMYSYLRKGLIRVNEKKVKQDYHIVSGDVINVAQFLALSERKQTESKTETLKTHETDSIPCVFRNSHILILNKPYDIPVHETGSYKGMTLNQFVLEHYAGKEDSLSFKPGPLHRLDRKTTGLIAFSQSITGARTFTEQLKAHDVKKTYLSVVEGNLTSDLTFTDMLSKASTSDESSFHTMNVASEETAGSDAKKAVTRLHSVAHGTFKGRNVTLVEVTIETGRTHQIRSQCASHGYPLLGDTAYGGSAYECLFLHAWKLQFTKPEALGLPDAVYAPLPARFSEFIEKYLPATDISLYT